MTADRNKLMLEIKEHGKQLQQEAAVALTVSAVTGSSHSSLRRHCMLLYLSFRSPFIKKSPSGYTNVKRKNSLCLKSVVNGTRPWWELRTVSFAQAQRSEPESLWSRSGHWEGGLLEGSRQIRTESLPALMIRIPAGPGWCWIQSWEKEWFTLESLISCCETICPVISESSDSSFPTPSHLLWLKLWLALQSPLFKI